MTEADPGPELAAIYNDLQIVAEVVSLRLPPGLGEADRAARVRRFLDVSADLNYALSTYTHRVLAYSGRRRGIGGLHDDTIALQDALESFASEVRAIAGEYRTMVSITPIERPMSHA